MELTIGIQNKETTEAGTLIITMNPVNTSRWISTPELIEAEIAVQPYGVISVPDYEDLAETELMCYVTLDYVTYGTGLADLIAGDIGDEITFTATGTGGGGENDAEITKWLEGNQFSLYDSAASFISQQTFYLNSKLTAIECTSVTEIGSSAFRGCTNLTTASFPEVTTIRPDAFNSCYALVSVSFPKVKSVYATAFSSCYSLPNFPFEGITTLSNGAFFRCSELTEVNLSTYVNAIQSNTFNGCIKLSKVNAPVMSSSIGSYAFGGNTALTNISMPLAKITQDQAFSNCTALVSVDFPNMFSIGSSTFKGCTNLETIMIGSIRTESLGAPYLRSDAFNGCTKLASIYILLSSGTVTPTIDANTFNNCPITDSTMLGHYGSIYVLSAAYSKYEASAAWSSYMARIVSM